MNIRAIYWITIATGLLCLSLQAAAFQPIDEEFGDVMWECTHNGNVYAVVEDGVFCPEFMYSITLPHARTHFGPNPPPDWMAQLAVLKIDDPDECVFGRRRR